MSDDPPNVPSTLDRRRGNENNRVEDVDFALKADFPDDCEPFRPEEWLRANEAVQCYAAAATSANPQLAIKERARAGLLDAHAERIVVDGMRCKNCPLSQRFWTGYLRDDSRQNWDLGDFHAIVFESTEVSAYAVRFRRTQIMAMVTLAESSPPAPKASGGRRRSDLWPEWTAELAHYLHNHGCPDGEGGQGTDLIIEEVDKGLADRGLKGPSRSTVQKTVRAVLDRLRAPETSSN